MSDQNPNPTPALPLTPEQPAAGNPDAIVNALMNALESRQQRVERSVTRDMAVQYGMTEEELTSLLNAHRAEKAKQLSPEAQRQLDAANARVQTLMLHNEVNRLGAAMGLLDTQLAVTLLDHTLIRTEGETVTGVQDALSLLKEDKPYLFSGFSQPLPMAWGQQHGSGADEREADFRRALGLKPAL